MHDFVIRNARIANGLGDPLVEGDLGVKDGRVAQVGNISEDAVETLDAAGAVLAPGVIDLHTHYDGQVSWDTEMAPSSRYDYFLSLSFWLFLQKTGYSLMR